MLWACGCGWRGEDEDYEGQQKWKQTGQRADGKGGNYDKLKEEERVQ